MVLCSGCRLAGTPHESKLAATNWAPNSNKVLPAKTAEFGKAESLAAIWTDSVASASGVASVRGFGGRIYFYDKDGLPTRVDGELAIYAFDDTDDDQKTTPDRVYKFTQADLQRHYSETQLGPSYSVWLPWDRVGGDRKSIALLPVFKSVDNQIVKSSQSLNVLPGKSPPISEARTDPFRVLGSSSTVANMRGGASRNFSTDYGVQLVSHEEPVQAGGRPQPERTTTIDLPRGLNRRLQNDLTIGDVGEVAAGMNATVSYGPGDIGPAAPSPTSPTASKSAVLSPSDSTLASSEAGTTTQTSSRRAVFGAPGAFK